MEIDLRTTIRAIRCIGAVADENEKAIAHIIHKHRHFII